MTPDKPQKPKFEPPPWEREAFERFHANQGEARAQDAPESALPAILESTVPVTQERDAAGQTASAGTGNAAAAPTGAQEEAADKPGLSDSRIDAMLVQLKAEEEPALKPNMRFINVLIVAFVVSGLAIAIQAVVLFGRVRNTSPAGMMLAGTVSFVVLLVGASFIAGAVLLFRKYYR